MPILTLKTTTPPSANAANTLVRQLTELSTHLLSKRAEVTAFVWQVVPDAHWWIGGASTPQAHAQLDIRVTQGTNTAQEKAEFVRAAHAALEAAYRPQGLHPASYVSVLEVPATDWGYGGLTQRERGQRGAAVKAEGLARYY